MAEGSFNDLFLGLEDFVDFGRGTEIVGEPWISCMFNKR